MSWRDDPITVKQKELIEDMQEHSMLDLPEFTGSTKGEAHDYISMFGEMAHESQWAYEHGYA